MKMRYKLLIILVCFLSISCKDKKTKLTEEMQIVKEWTGKTVIIPNDTMVDSREYKILLYIDSTITSLHPLWQVYIMEMTDKVDFLFYSYSRKVEALTEFGNSFPNCHVYIDTIDELNKLNKFPVNPVFHCFLLDKSNKILAMGNPARNSKIWELYKKIISGKVF
jgi:hypothetical protein